MTYSIQLPRGFSAAFLASMYLLGFIITPYWRLSKSTGENIFYLALTIGIGAVWLLLSANSFQLKFSLQDLGLLLCLLAGVLALNYRPLNSVIPFRGDEASHIERTLALMSRIPPLQSLIVFVLFLIFMAAGFKAQKWGILIGLFIVAYTVLYFSGQNSFEDVMKGQLLFFLRWPFINYWFFAAFPKLTSLVTSPYHEALYRIVPVLSMIGVSWIYPKKLDSSNLASKIAWGLAVATIPLIFYYSSILYLEPTAVLLMTVVCLDANNLLHANSKDIGHIPAWYALLLIGFIKETTIPFLFCFLVIRIIIQMQTWARKNPAERSKKTLLRLLVGEFGILFVLLAPVFLYLHFRSTLISTRSFILDISNLFELENYYFVALAFLQQFGPFLFFFIAGCILFVKDRELSVLLYYLATVAAILVFHMVDQESYIGYSRFNLFILAPILAGSIRLMIWASKQKQYIANILLLIAIGSNLLLSPIHLDGVKTPHWGNYLKDTGEHYYPYQEALVWLKNNYPQKRMLFTGLDFYYPFQFYWNKLDWKPKRDGIPSEGINEESLAILRILAKAENERYSVVVYRVRGTDLEVPQETGKFRIQVIENSAHTLLIFYKP